MAQVHHIPSDAHLERARRENKSLGWHYIALRGQVAPTNKDLRQKIVRKSLNFVPTAEVGLIDPTFGPLCPAIRRLLALVDGEFCQQRMCYVLARNHSYIT